MKYIALKPFFKLSEQKNYAIGDTIELSKEDAEAMLNDGFLEEVKEPKKAKKDD
jgi:hypothetical protein